MNAKIVEFFGDVVGFSLVMVQALLSLLLVVLVTAMIGVLSAFACAMLR